MSRSLSVEYQEQRAISDKCFNPTGAFIEFKEESDEQAQQLLTDETSSRPL